ncbi:MAG: metal-dependent hydrolase [Nanoarchaeota archaeon]|nr:metal-dependent hydrolase [Nanoarchaeota archaeon]MBU1644596.1 metal-dependent hydrolase [Nanoarchaeota archaeon]MBU1977131.1 metal-dependent hydrolase [Nanoarchaeota archaeon]
MTFAFGHLIGAWLLGKGYEFCSKKKIGRFTWFFLLLGGILPDIDFLISWTLDNPLHRTFTHSLFFIFIVSLLPSLIFLKDKEKITYALALGTGIFMHLFLDLFSRQGVPLLWPNQLLFSYLRVGLYNPEFSLYSNVVAVKQIKLATIDMGLGTAWIFYLWFRKKIQF